MTATDISSLSPVLSKVRESIRQGIEGSIRYLSIEQRHPMGLRLRAWTRSAETRSAIMSEDSRIEIMVRWLNYARRSELVVLRLCYALPLTDMDTLYVSNVVMDAEIWSLTFGAFKRLKSIHVSGAIACGLIPALCRTADKNSASDDGHSGAGGASGSHHRGEGRRFLINPLKSSFPGLKSLVLEGVHFYSRHESRYIDINQLHTCLARRRTSNIGLDSLHLTDCYYLDDADVDLLRDTVARLECDCIDLKPYAPPAYAEEDTTNTEEGP